MPDARSLLAGAVLSLMIVLSACSEDQSDNAQFASDALRDDFQSLIEDARYEMSQGNLPEAGRLYDKALAIKRDDAGIWVDIARLRFRGGEHSSALEAADFALELDPELPAALIMRAQLVRDAYGFAEALPWFERGLAIHPENEDLLAEYAATLGELGRNGDMLNAVRELAEVNPRNPRVHYIQAVLAARAHDPVLAKSLLKRSGAVEARMPFAILLSALTDIQQGNYDTAATWLEELLDRQPGNLRVMELLARALWLAGRDRELVDRFKGQADAGYASPYLIMLVGRSMERMGARSEAVDYITKARTMPSSQVIALPVSDNNSQRLPQPSFAIRQAVINMRPSSIRRVANNWLRDFPQSADIKVLAGDAALAVNDPARSLQLHSQAAQIRRPWPLTKKIAYAYGAVGDGDAADALLMRHIRAEPLNTEALIVLAQNSADNGDWLRVAVLLDNVIARGAGNDLRLLELRLQAAQELQDKADADKFAQALSTLRPRPFLKE